MTYSGQVENVTYGGQVENVTGEEGRPAAGAWIRSGWLRWGMVGMVVLMAAVSAAAGASLEFLLGQIALLISLYLALVILSDRPLLNPPQATVALFYWWFGVGPVVTGGFYLAAGQPTHALYTMESGRESLWIVALGLPLLALAGRLTLNWLQATRLYAGFLLPEGFLYRPATILAFFAAGQALRVIMRLLILINVQGISTVNYLGGTVTNIWWVGVLNAMTRIETLGMVALIFALATKGWRSYPWWLITIGLVIIGQNLVAALTSGWKTDLVSVFFYALCARLAWQQRPPLGWMVALVVGFLVFINPFVTYGRQLAQIARAATAQERQYFFEQALEQGAYSVKGDWRSLQVESLFRGIYPLAGAVTRQNEFWDGAWDGQTLLWGLQVIIPRALFEDKPDSTIGNFFSRMVGAAIGLTNSRDYAHSSAIAIPFEFMGNYGWLAGVASFPVLGAFIALLSGWLLSAERVSDHPLSPFLVMLVISVEASLGSFLADVRDLFIPVAVAFGVWLLFRRL
ncbi:MAG: hypothetical protein AB1791_04450 [Chloroflexota bacterium]